MLAAALAQAGKTSTELDGYLVLRFTAFVVRYRPDYVAVQIRDAFRRSGHALTA